MDEYISIKIICEKECNNDETEVRVLEKRDDSAIIMLGLSYAHDFERHEREYEKKPTIYFGDKLVKDYVRLPFQNVYQDDDEFGKVCLFARAKYQFFFYRIFLTIYIKIFFIW